MEISTFRGYYLHFVDRYVLRGYYSHFVEISMFRSYYPHFMEISTPCGYYPHFVHMIYVDNITRYLARNVHPIFCMESFSESDWCITSLPDFNFIIFFCSSSFCVVSFVSEYKLNPNPTQIYVPYFSTSIKSFFLPLNIPVFMLYWCVV